MIEVVPSPSVLARSTSGSSVGKEFVQSPTPEASRQEETSVVIVGGGLAGVWTGYQLRKAGIPTTIVFYKGDDRGGLLGASRRSAGMFNTFILGPEYPEGYLKELGRGQIHPSVEPTLRRHLSHAIEELRQLVPLKPVKIGLALETGVGEHFLQSMYERFVALGGRIIDGWVTRVVADRQGCSGIQYESAAGFGKVRCRAIVIASGGYAGLFGNAIRTNCFGSVLGSFLRAGGVATNLEFLFKHGYGNVDANALTPTEELPGAEIYDHQHERVTWLEELLFHKQGTKTHLQAVQFWLRNPEREFYVDLSYRGLYEKVWELNGLIAGAIERGSAVNSNHADVVAEMLEKVPEGARTRFSELVYKWISEKRTIGYQMFEELKPTVPRAENLRFRVRPLTYFSMGGIGHVDFATNLKNVFVTGEAMHDFGANRVGGLPWSLYLASAYVIVEKIQAALQVAEPIGDFEIEEKRSRFDAELLRSIQARLYECHDKEFSAARALGTIEWLRSQRQALEMAGADLDDGVNWLTVAEAVMQASVCRRESRGFFFRFDYQNQDPQLDEKFSCVWYNQSTGKAEASLMSWEEIEGKLGPKEFARGALYEPVIQCR